MSAFPLEADLTPSPGNVSFGLFPDIAGGQVQSLQSILHSTRLSALPTPSAQFATR
jgi:hypothetical protein